MQAGRQADESLFWQPKTERRRAGKAQQCFWREGMDAGDMQRPGATNQMQWEEGKQVVSYL